MNEQILIVEDDLNVALVVGDALRAEGYRIEHAADGRGGLQRALRPGIDLTLLDAGLPGADGFTVCAELRRRGVRTPILFLTARAETDDKVNALRLGADDYLTKPFHVPELLARIQALLRRTRGELLEFQFGEIFADFYRGRVTREGRPVDLTAKELVLLRYLVAKRGSPVSRAELLWEVWGYRSTNTRTVDVHVGTLRHKLEDASREPTYILTIRGEGYQFAAKEL